MKNYLSAQIDLAAIAHNCRILRKLIPANCKFCIAAKCNAYGHGIETVLPALKSAADMLAVSTIEEASRLIALKCKLPILVLGSEFSIYSENQKKQIAEWLVQNKIRITAMLPNDIKTLANAARKFSKKALVHLKLDTGMGRMGLVDEDLLKLIEFIDNQKAISIEGLYTHFANAHDKDKTYSNLQLHKFNTFLSATKLSGLKIPIIHTANSAALADLPDSHFNMVRPGISIYGYNAGPDIRNKLPLKPVMKITSYLTAVKKVQKGTFIGYGSTCQAPEDMMIALVPVGYGDGYDRRLSNSGQMKISNTLVPVVGRISMDQTIIDLRPLTKKGTIPSAGHEVTVIDNDPAAPNSIESIAKYLNTIPYEMITRLGPRIIRMPAKDKK